MKKISYLCCLIVFLSLCACSSSSNDDEVKAPEKNGSVETTISVAHMDSFDLLTTRHFIWRNNSLVLTKIHTDTIPALGTTTEEGEDADGNTQNVTVPKDYEFYITVK